MSQLQRALGSLQVYNEKREQSEKKLRSQLESEITELKLSLASKNAKSNLTATRVNPGSSTSTATPSPRNYTAPPPYPGSSASSSNQNLAQTASSSSSIQNLTRSQDNLAPELASLQEKLRLSEDKIASLTAVVQRWEHFFALEPNSDGGVTTTPAGTNPNTPSWTGSRGGTPHFSFNNGPGTGGTSSGCSSNGALDELSSTANRAADIEWKIKDLENRLVERDNMLRALGQQGQGQGQLQVQYGYSTPYSSPYVPTGKPYID